jgi:hypothetical protein
VPKKKGLWPTTPIVVNRLQQNRVSLASELWFIDPMSKCKDNLQIKGEVIFSFHCKKQIIHA